MNVGPEHHGSITVRIRYSAEVALTTGCRMETLTLCAKTLGELLDYLGRLYKGEFSRIVDDFHRGDGSFYVEVNGSRAADPLCDLRDGDEVHVMAAGLLRK